MRILLIAAIAVTAAAQPRANASFECSAADVEDFGLTCSAAQPCPVYLELSAADSVSGRIVVAGNFHTDAMTLYSALLASEDGGRTWKEAHSRIRSAALEQIQFVDLQHGWVSGQVLGNLPRDPFLLATADGGKTWHAKPVFEETQVGAIEQFWFESKDAGTIVIDLVHQNETGGRHERLQTMTGGDSWALQEVSATPIHLKHGPSEPVWRIRAPERSKVFHLERNLGGGTWEIVAIFPVEVGSCRGE